MAKIVAPKKLIRFDWFIKKMLRSKADFEILEGFLSELLKKDLTKLLIIGYRLTDSLGAAQVESRRSENTKNTITLFLNKKGQAIQKMR